MEKKITQLFDELTPEEAALAGDECRIEHGNKDISARILSLTKRKAGITMKETTNTKAKKRLKRSTILAIAAAAVLTCTAAAAGITAIHERSVNRYFGEGAAAELSKKGIMINKVDVSDDYTMTVDLAYATDDYARVMFTFEGKTDEAKAKIANTTNWYWELKPDFKEGAQEAFGCGGGCIPGFPRDEEFKKDKENGIYTFDITIDAKLSDIESYTLSMIPEEWSETEGVGNPDGLLNLMTVDFELTPNITPVTFVSNDGKADIWLCDYEINVPDNFNADSDKYPLIPYLWYSPEDQWFNEDNIEGETKEAHNEYYLAHKDDVLVTFVYDDGSKTEFTTQNLAVQGIKTYFTGTSIDSQKVEKIILGGGKYTYTRAE